jgi:hypothetical protein
MRWSAITLLSLSICLGAGLPVALAQESAEKTPQRVPRINSEFEVDGVLNEDFWSDALVMGVNNEVRPGDNIPAPVETDMLLAYSDTHFLVAFKAYDPDPSKICAHLCDRDAMWDDEWVVIGVDTYNDQRGGYEFAANPLGIQGDCGNGIHGDGNSWDGIWESAGKIYDWGYAVEMAIPFSSIRFQKTDGDQIWGVDAVRSYPRDVRHHISLYHRDRDNSCYYCQMDKLIGFEGATPGRNIEFDPTFSAIGSQKREDFPTGDFSDIDDEYDVGLTARWGVTPNLTFSGAINPDFSQVEADAFQLDVNRQYALWYEEKRPFFLEGAGMFDDFYSRSIASPIWGAKLTAKAGRNGLGVLVARDDITNLIFSGSEGSRSASLDMESTATAVRYQRDIGSASGVSFMFNGREGEDYYNRLGGIEMEFWPTSKIQIEGEVQSAYTSYPDDIINEYDQPEGEFSGQEYRFYGGRFTGGLDVYGHISSKTEDFRTDLDFEPSAGFSHYELGVGHTWNRESGSCWTMLNFGGCYNYQHYKNGSPRARGYNFWINYQGPRQLYADLSGWLGKDKYSGEEFETWSFDFEAGFWPSGDLFLVGEANYGEYIDFGNMETGRRLQIEPGTEFRIGRRLSARIGHTYERFDTDYLDSDYLYIANVSFLRTVYQFTPRSFARVILQYAYEDSQGEESEETLASQLLFSYKINPQTVLFLGYADGHYGDDDTQLTQSDRTFFAKIGYALVM